MMIRVKEVMVRTMPGAMVRTVKRAKISRRTETFSGEV
jgi:hypothetical protein